MLSCKQIDMAMYASEQALTRSLLLKRTVARNAYYGKIPDGEPFPLESGTRIKGHRLGRIHIQDPTGWRPVEDEACTTNACDFEPDVISHGHSDYFFSLVQKDLRTDWLCLERLALRPDAAEQVQHLEDGIRRISAFVNDEFRRSRYIGFTGNKMLATVPRDAETSLATEKYFSCDAVSQINNGWVFEVRQNGEMDENHVRVCVDPADIDLISEQTLDMFDEARAYLALEDESFMDGTGLMDVLIPDITMAPRMALQADEDVNFAASQQGWKMIDLSQTYGTERVLRNYSLRADPYAMRFYPDLAFNDTLIAGDGYAFDENDPDSWPRFARVHAYAPVKSTGSSGSDGGIEFKVNKNYLKAPFGISTIRTPRIMKVMSFPSTGGVRSATKVGGFGFDGIANWNNPDWECNVRRNKGFWMLSFRLAAKPVFTEEGFSWFIRINRRMRLAGNPCTILEKACDQEVAPYCYEGLAGEDVIDSGFGFNAATDN